MQFLKTLYFLCRSGPSPKFSLRLIDTDPSLRTSRGRFSKNENDKEMMRLRLMMTKSLFVQVLLIELSERLKNSLDLGHYAKIRKKSRLCIYISTKTQQMVSKDLKAVTF